MKKTIPLIVLLSIIIGVQLQATPISVKRAQAIAENLTLFNTQTRQSSAPLQCIYSPNASTRSDDFQAPYYVFGRQEEPGFVIISGDDELTPVVGYSTSSAFEAEKMPDALISFLQEYQNYVEAVQSQKEAPTMQSSLLPGGKAIEPLLKTKWGQGSPYNKKCPMYSYRTLTGCVATAMAQIMKHHNWPLECNATLNTVYEDKYTSLKEKNNINFQFDWENMLDVYDEEWNYDTQQYDPYYTEVQGDAVANLMVNCGVSCYMSYSVNASGATSTRALHAFKKYFKYSPDVSIHYRNTYREDEWLAIIRNNLEQNMPIFYAGTGPYNAGHAFVCDGIDEQNLLHINWGWDGYCDGYFNMCYMNPDGTGIDSPNGYYNRDHEIIANIRPIAEGEEEEVEIPKMLTAYNMILCTGTTYKKEEDNSIKINMERVLNNSDHSNTIRYTFGMIVFDKDNQIIAYRKKTSTFSGFSYRTNIDFYFGTKSLSYDSKTDTYLPNGEYTMIPVLFNDEYLSEYTMEDVIPMDVNGGISRFDITVTDTEIIVMPDKMYTEPDLKMISIKENSVLCLRKENDPVKLLIANYSPTSQRNGIRAYLMPENANEEDIDLDKLDYLSTNNVVYGCNEQIVYLYCTYYYEAGTFRVLPYRTLSDNTLERIPEESPQYLTIEDLKGNAHVRLTQPLMIRCNTADRTQNDISVTLSVKVQGFYEGPIQLYALKEGDTEDKEVLIMERNIDLDINQGLYDEWYGQSDAYSKLDGDVYTFYLKQKMGDRMIRMSPFDYNSYTVTFKKDEAAALQLVAPLTINDGKPVKIGKSFKAKITILSATDFEGPIWGNAKSLEYGAWNNAAFIEEKTVKLKANEPQEIEFDGFCYDATKKGEYPIALYYKSNDETYNVEMGEYASSATIQVVSTAISLAAPIVFNDESPMLIGKSHMLKMTLVSDDDYVGTIKGDSYMEINGASERIALLGDIPIDLTANVPKEVSTSINLYGITEPGIYKLNLYHKQESELEVISLGEYTYSANYEMVNFELKPTSALIINNEEDVVQGTTGSVTLNLKSNVNSHTYYRIKDIPNVINGVITYIGLQANQEHQFKVNYNCDKNAPIGEYEIEIIYLHILTQEEEILDLGEYKASAKFKVVSSTGIRGEESTQIYAVAQSDGFVLKGLLGKEEIEVFDLSGRQIYQLYNTSQEVFIPVAGGASNTYLISIRNKSQKFVLKVILPIN